MIRRDRTAGGRPVPAAPGWLLRLLGVALLAAVGCRRVPPAAAPRDQPAVVVVESDEEDGTIPSVAEHEPNDEPRQAQALRVGQAVRGTLRGRGRADRDWYALEVDRPQQVTRLQLGPLADEDLRLELYAAPGQRIAVADNEGPGVGEVLPNLALEAGRYLVRVRARLGAKRKAKPAAGKPGRAPAIGGSGVVASGAVASAATTAYRLLFTLRDRGEQEELEPNDGGARATELRFGASNGEAVGYCGARQDVDWYRLAPRAWPADRLLHLAADGLDGVRFALSWRDADGQVIAQREARANEGAELANLQLPPPGLGAMLTVDCRSGYDLDVPYVLRLGPQPAADTEREPNDRVGQATALADGQPLRGVLADRQDVDLYRLPLTQAGTLRVEVTPPAQLDVGVDLIDAGGQALATADAGGAGQAEVISELAVLPPQALVRVRVGAQARRGDPAARYRLRVLFQPAAPAPSEEGVAPLGPPPLPPP